MSHTEQLPNIDPKELSNPYESNRLEMPVLWRLSDSVKRMNSPGGVIYENRVRAADALIGVSNRMRPKQK